MRYVNLGKKFVMSYSIENEIVKECLMKVGVIINDVYDLVNTKASYPKAIPILVDLLKNSKVQDPKLLEGIVRSLAVKEAKGIANDTVFQKFIEVQQDWLRWAIGNTINVIATAEDLDKLIVIVKDKKYGTARQMPTMALGRFKSPEVEDVLVSLLSDRDVLPHAIDALGKHKSIKAKPYLEKLLTDSSLLVRKEAKKALKRILK